MKNIIYAVLITTLSLIVSISHAQTWDQMERDYNNLVKSNNYELAIAKGKEMLFNVVKDEGDSSLKVAISYKLIGNAYSEFNKDSALFYYDNGLKILELQNRNENILASKLIYNKAIILLSKEKYDDYFSLLTHSANIVRELKYPEFPFSEWPVKKLYDYNVAIQDTTQYEKLLKECIYIYRKYDQIHSDEYKILTKNIFNDSVLNIKGISIQNWFDLIQKFSDKEQYDSVIYYCNIINIDYENNLIPKSILIKANLKLGSAFLEKRIYDKSLQTFLTTLDFIEDNPRINNLIKYICYNNIGLCYYRVSNYIKSEDYYRLALKIIYDNWNDLSDYFPVAASNLSKTLIGSGSYSEAKELLTNALKFELQKHETYPKSNGTEELHQIYDALGDIYIKEDNYVEAEKYYQKSIDIAKQLHSNKLRSMGLSSLSDAYHKEGNYLYSIDITKEAAEISLLDGDTVAYAFRLDDLSHSYSGIGELFIADSFNNEARKLLKYQQNNKDYIISLFRGGMIKINQKDYKGAMSLFEEAASVNTSAYNGKSSMSPYIINGLATCNYYLGNYEKAANLFKSILCKDILDRDDILPNDDRKSMLGLYCITLKKLNDYTTLDTIINYYANSSLYELSTRLPILLQKKKLDFLYDQQYVFDIFFSNLMGTRSQPEQLYNVGYNIAFKTKGYILNDEMNMRKFIDNDDTEAKQLFSKLIKYKSCYAKNNGNYNSYGDSVTKFENEISRKVKPFERCLEYRRMDYNNIVSSLKKDEISIEIYRFKYLDDSLFKHPNDSIPGSHYVYSALIAKNGWVSPKFIYLFEGSDINYIWDDNNDSSSINSLYSTKTGRGKTFYQLFWSPLEKFLDGIHTIYIAPTGTLNNINLLAIPIDTNTMIGEKYSVHILGSTADAVNYKPSHITKSIVKSVIVYGGIDYDKSQNNLLKIEENKSSVDSQISGIASRNAVAKFGYLSGTLTEAKHIQLICEQHEINAIIDTGTYATEESFKSLNGKRDPFILHIATHGYFFSNPKYLTREDSNKHNWGLEKNNVFKWGDDPFLRSGLIFAGANNTWGKADHVSNSTEDGILTSYEISNLDLSNCQLVVLSACETGLGDIKGSEGVYGLQRAFKIAGVKNIIMSLWKVPDEQTSELMTSFYTYCFAGKSIHDALQAAQTDMKKKYPPYYWAGFKLLE